MDTKRNKAVKKNLVQGKISNCTPVKKNNGVLKNIKKSCTHWIVSVCMSVHPLYSFLADGTSLMKAGMSLTGRPLAWAFTLKFLSSVSRATL